jgi:hypothetical protein
MHCSFIPREVAYLTRFDDFKKYLENIFDMPDKMVALVIRFLEQNNGRSRRLKISTKKFSWIIRIRPGY